MGSTCTWTSDVEAVLASGMCSEILAFSFLLITMSSLHCSAIGIWASSSSKQQGDSGDGGIGSIRTTKASGEQGIKAALVILLTTAYSHRSSPISPCRIGGGAWACSLAYPHPVASSAALWSCSCFLIGESLQGNGPLGKALE